MGVRKKEALEQFNRDNILGAAKELFESKGVEKTTMDDIAALADYSKSTIYVYFKSKEEIYNSIVEDYIDILIHEMSVCIEANKNFEDSYYKLCECLANFEERYPGYYASLMGEDKLTNSKKKSDTKEMTLNSGISEVITNLLTKGIDNKTLRSDIDIKPTALYVWSAISGIIRVADKKEAVFYEGLNMDKEEYLRYSFRTFYESLARR